MSWGLLIGLSVAAWAQKLLGVALASIRPPSAGGRELLQLVAVPVLAALVAVQTFGDGERLVLDARAPALAFAILAVAVRAPFLVVVLGAGAVAALIRLAA